MSSSGQHVKGWQGFTARALGESTGAANRRTPGRRLHDIRRATPRCTSISQWGLPAAAATGDFPPHVLGAIGGVGETRVDLQHLLDDLRHAYGGSVEETILTEIVANCLDSEAGTIRLATAPAERTLTVKDDGRGMQRRELARYHDIAATTKTRGEGIGFAGVGIKLALLVSQEVVTETRRRAVHVATRWRLASRHRAPWKWIPPPGLVAPRGTAVRVLLSNPLSPLLDAGFVEETLGRHFDPLMDPALLGNPRAVLPARGPIRGG
jgi:hypothetical protein